MHPYSLRRIALTGPVLLAACVTGYAQDCQDLLVPDFDVAQRDIASDLAYLAVISKENFRSHKQNANGELHPKRGRELFQADMHLGLDLPIAKELLQASVGYDEFDQRRKKKLAEYQFSYSSIELAKYYTQMLPEPRASQYAQCIHAAGLHVRITKSNRDFVELIIGWRPEAGASAEASLAQAVVTGGQLQGSLPTNLASAGDLTLSYIRDLGKEFRFAPNTGAAEAAVFVPRYMNSEPSVVASTAQCASAAKVVRATYQQVLQKPIPLALLSKQAALLTHNVNSVRQLVERFANGSDYTERFVQGKSREEVLRGYYRHILAREPDAAGLAYNANLIQSLGHAKIAVQFAQGQEYQRRFGQWIVPGEPARLKYCSK